MNTTQEILKNVTLDINGLVQSFIVPTDELLVDTLRERAEYTSVKRGCDNGECGCCTVIMNGKAVPSCMTLTVEADGSKIITAEGLSNGDELDPVQQAFIDKAAVQCGFCTPGMLMTARALLNENPRPSDEEIIEAMENNYCRCTGYVNIFEAIKQASEQ